MHRSLAPTLRALGTLVLALCAPAAGVRAQDAPARAAASQASRVPSIVRPQARIVAQQSANAVTIDARVQPPPPQTGFLHMGANRSPAGHTIGVNSRYLMRDGRPWLPVMGEFHYTRYPEAEWAAELARMKAAGVDIVATYIIWIHHEEIEGQFDWSGRRDLRHFAQLCAQQGLLLYPRIGPWSHAEVRRGGFPDWLVARVGDRARSNDPTYLRYVARYYDQIGQQLKGLLWKDGGPVIGIQLENEYNGRGPGRGPEHILKLKDLARRAGFDVPLYTVTGWDNAVLPPAEVIPVFGGYPDWPWDQSIETLPLEKSGEVYAFRFANRWAGNMGVQGASGQPAETSQEALSAYPFLGAEYGPGIQITYHRRPVIYPNDVAAMLPVQLGSGVNLYGYYMFHGGQNPPGKLTTLQESQRTGYPTDVPVKSYDFQAPLGEYGEARPSLGRLEPVHYFLNAFGRDLAPMVVRRPDVVPAGPADTTVPRVSARTLGDRGFVFFNNYLRNYHLPDRPGFQVTVRLPGGSVRLPSAPIDLPAGAYGIWPVNLDLGGARLRYATAQLVTRVPGGSVGDVVVFFAIPGIQPELAFDAATVASVEAPGASVTRAGGQVLVGGLRPGTGASVTVRPRRGASVRILLLSSDQAQQLRVVTVAGTRRLLLTPQQVFLDGDAIHLRATGAPDFSLLAFPAFEALRGGALRAAGQDGLFTRYTAALPAHPVAVRVTKLRDADTVPPVKLFNAVTWRSVAIALAPDDSAFAHAAAWRIEVPPDALKNLADAFLEIRYVGDVARLYAGDELLDDNFFNGTPWRIGLRRYTDRIGRGPLVLRILPLRADAPIYIQPETRPHLAPGSQVAELQEVSAQPQYEIEARVGGR